MTLTPSRELDVIKYAGITGEGQWCVCQLTLSIILIREIIALLWARHESAPEEASVQSFPQTMDINVAGQAALLKGLGKVGIVYVVVEKDSEVDGQVIMPV